MKTTTDFQLVEIHKLIPYVNNARTHSKEQMSNQKTDELANVRVYKMTESKGSGA